MLTTALLLLLLLLLLLFVLLWNSDCVYVNGASVSPSLCI